MQATSQTQRSGVSTHSRGSLEAAGERQRPGRKILLGLLLVVSFALRAWTAHPGLDKSRFWDERFTIENIVHSMDSGSLAPVRGFYGTLSYLPHLPFVAAAQALHGLTGVPALRTLEPPGPGPAADRLTPTGYLVVRLVNCAIGTLSVYLCYLLGTTLIGPAGGLWAAFFLAFTPWHVRQSAVFKPDIVLVAALLLAFWLAIRAARRDRFGAYLAAGAGVGIAASAKLNGLPIAVVLVAAALSLRRFDRRTLSWVCAAGLASLAAFLALNPWVLFDLGTFLRDFGGNTLGIYRPAGGERYGSAPEVAWSLLPWLAGGLAHGAVVGAAALVGAVLLVVRAARSGWARTESATLAAATLLAFLLAYWLSYSAISRNLDAWRAWFFVTPFTAILAGFGVVEGWRRAGPRLPAAVRRLVAAIGTAALVFLPARASLVFAHFLVVPSTAELALGHLVRRLPGLDARVIAVERALPPITKRVESGRTESATQLWAERLSDLGHLTLDLADAELFDPALAADDGELFYRWRARPRTGVSLRPIEPGWLTARGEGWLVVLHPWKRVDGDRLTLRRAGGRFVGQLPPCRSGAAASLTLRVPADLAERAEPKLTVGKQGVRWLNMGSHDPGQDAWYASERVLCAPRRRRIRLELPATGSKSHPTFLTVWGAPYPGNWAGRTEPPREVAP